MSEGNDPLLIVSEAKQNMAWIAGRLARLAESFSLVGNDKVSNALGTYSNELYKQIEWLTQAEGKIIKDQVRLAQFNSQNLVAAALAGIEAEKRKGLGDLIAEDARQPVKSDLVEMWKDDSGPFSS